MATAVGIDLGAEAIKGVVLSRNSKGVVELVAAGTLPIGDLGHMEDSQDKTLALGVKLKQLVKTARLKAHTRRIGAGGKTTSIRYLQVPPVPPWRLEMLASYEVNERSADKEPTTFDYHILDVPETGGQYTVMIGTLREAAANDLLSVGRSAGLGEVEIDLEALALYNAYYHGHGFDSDKTVLVADIGADDLTILLCRGGGLYFARTIMGAGQRFTQVLADELKLELPEAEELKKTVAEITFDISAHGRTGRVPRQAGATTMLPRSGGVPPGASGSTPATSGAMNLGAVPGASSSGGTRPAPSAMQAKPEATAAAPKDGLVLQPSPVDEVILDDTEPLSMPEGAEQKSAAGPESSSQTVKLPPPTFESREDKRRRQITSALVREAAALCAALENAVLFSKQQTKLRDIKVDRIYLTGGGSKLKGLIEFMSRRMRMEVMPLEPLRGVSLARLPEEHANALRAEQHTMAVALGLAMGDLLKGAFSFQLIPNALIEKNRFWSRGAYLYYAAALGLAAMGMLLYAPYRNTEALTANFNVAEEATQTAATQAQEVKKLEADNEERRNQLKQIADNTLSGHYFLNLLAELKSTARITDDIWLTQISTSMPIVVRKLGGPEGGGMASPGGPVATAGPISDPRRGARGSGEQNATEPDTFQTQRRIYLRGFARGPANGAERIQRIRDFYGKLLPYPDDPDNPHNLFKDVRPIWFSTEELRQGTRHLFAPDSVILRPKGALAAAVFVYDKETSCAVRRNLLLVPGKDGNVELIGPGMEKAEYLIMGDTATMPDSQKVRMDGDEVKAEGHDWKLKSQKLKIEENVWFLTEFVLEAYTEGTREKAAPKKGEKPAAKPALPGAGTPVHGTVQQPVEATQTAPVAAPAADVKTGPVVPAIPAPAVPVPNALAPEAKVAPVAPVAPALPAPDTKTKAAPRGETTVPAVPKVAPTVPETKTAPAPAPVPGGADVKTDQPKAKKPKFIVPTDQPAPPAKQ
ncbi:MAG TPA: pilus assembly protein PilM [Planctomycetota bacterium]|jgi:Tfp pilus assembly PilM family ATPase